MMFTPVKGSEILLRNKGLYRTSPVFRGPANRLFAKWGNSIVRIMTDGHTSGKAISWSVFQAPNLRLLGLVFVCDDDGDVVTIDLFQ